MATIAEWFNGNRNRYLSFINANQNIGLDVLCNICGYRFARFQPFNNRLNALCPVCGSLERHRHIAFLLLGLLTSIENAKILHFAPEHPLKNLLIHAGADYYDADIRPGITRYQVDISKIQFEENFFDIIIASHILEHIPDDLLAMKNLFRVLKHGGTAILCVPFTEFPIEDSGITDPEQRRILFGQSDHVRGYDLPTFHQRLLKSGFKVAISLPENLPPILNECIVGEAVFKATKQ